MAKSALRISGPRGVASRWLTAGLSTVAEDAFFDAIPITITVSPGGLVLAGGSVDATYPCTVTVSAGEIILAGGNAAPTNNTPVTIAVGSASATLGGGPVALVYACTIAVTGGNATLSGAAVALVYACTVAVTGGNATLGGGTVAASYPILITVDAPAELIIGGEDVAPTFVLPGPPQPGAGSAPGVLRLCLTSLHYPVDPDTGHATRAHTLAVLQQYTDARVTIPKNDARTASVTIETTDPAAAIVQPYSTMLHVLYVTPTGSYLVFWGPVVQPEWDTLAGTVTISAVDPSIRLQHHFLRYGDQALNPWDYGMRGIDGEDVARANPYGPDGKGRVVPIDSVGLRMLRDAANNTPEQTERGVPDLGVRDGTNTGVILLTGTSAVVKYDRGANVWDSMLDLTQTIALDGFLGAVDGPDFELEPISDGSPYYAQLNIFGRQGVDNTTVRLHDGFGLDNCHIVYKPGGRLVTHAHVQSGDSRTVTTSADADSSKLRGVYVEWDSAGYDDDTTNGDPLRARGDYLIAAYGAPPEYFTVTINPDAGVFYRRDFGIGDRIQVAVRRDQLRKVLAGEVTSVTLAQQDTAGNVLPEIEMAVVTGAGDSQEE